MIILAAAVTNEGRLRRSENKNIFLLALKKQRPTVSKTIVVFEYFQNN